MISIETKIEQFVSKLETILETYRSDTNIVQDGKIVNMVRFDPNLFISIQTEFQELQKECEYISKSKVETLMRLVDVFLNGVDENVETEDKKSIKNLWGVLNRKVSSVNKIDGLISLSSGIQNGIDKQVKGHATRIEYIASISRSSEVPCFIEGKQYINDITWKAEQHAEKLPGYKIYSCLIEIMLISYKEILKDALAGLKSNKSANEKNDGQK